MTAKIRAVLDQASGGVHFRSSDDQRLFSTRFITFEDRRIVKVDHGDLSVEVYVSRTGRSHRVWVNGTEVRTNGGTP